MPKKKQKQKSTHLASKDTQTKDPQQDDFKEISSAHDFFVGSLLPGFRQFNPDLLVSRKSLTIFDKMKIDEQVKASQTLKKNAVLKSGWFIEPASDDELDQTTAQFLENNLKALTGTVEDSLYEILSASDYGFSVTEKVYHILQEGEFSGKIGLKALKTRRPHGFNFEFDDFGELDESVGLHQQTQKGEKKYPPRKFVIYSFEKEFQNVYGKSDLRAAYRAWWSKNNFIKWWNIYGERNVMPIAKGTYDENVGKLQQDQLKAILEMVQDRMSVLLPKGADISWLEVKGNAAIFYLKSVDAFDLMIARALLMPNLLGLTGQQSVGSFAQAKQQFDIFALTIERIRKQLEETVMLEQVIKDLIDFNFVVDAYPKFKFLPLKEDDMLSISEQWVKLVAGGAVTNTPEDENRLRRLTGFQEKTKEELEELALEREKQKQKEQGLEIQGTQEEFEGIEELKEKIYANPELYSYTPEMEQLFQERTKKHIDLVIANMEKLQSFKNVHSETLIERAFLHDRSKYSIEEYAAYIWLTTKHDKENKGLEFEFPGNIEKAVKKATLHHIKNNKHHPQAHKNFNRMSLIDVLEMVSDWTAMAQELNQNNGSALEFAKEKVVEIGFNDTKKELIFTAIAELDGTQTQLKEKQTYRQKDEVEKKVNFVDIEKDLKKIEEQARTNLISIYEARKKKYLTKIRKDLNKGVLDQSNITKSYKYINDLKFTDKNKAEKGIEDLIQAGFDQAEKDIKKEVKNRQFADIFLKAVDAEKFLKNKKFWITDLIDTDILNQSRGTLIQVLGGELSIDEGMEALSNLFNPIVGDPTSALITPFRLETIIRTNLSDAYNGGRLAMGNKPGLKDFIIGWEYSEIMDDRTAPVSKFVDGKKIKKDDPALPKLRYPLHFNERGIFVPVTIDDTPVTWMTTTQKNQLRKKMGNFK